MHTVRALFCLALVNGLLKYIVVGLQLASAVLRIQHELKFLPNERHS